MSVSVDDLRECVLDSIRIAEVRIQAFKVALDSDAFAAFQAAEAALEHAAQVHVGREVIHRLDNGATVAEIAEVATREAVDVARFPKRSTSPTSNLAHQCLGAAWAEIAAWAGGAL